MAQKKTSYKKTDIDNDSNRKVKKYKEDPIIVYESSDLMKKVENFIDEEIKSIESIDDIDYSDFNDGELQAYNAIKSILIEGR